MYIYIFFFTFPDVYLLILFIIYSSEAAGRCLGELGPVDLSSIALHYGKDQLYARAADLSPDVRFQWIFIILNCMDNALTHHRHFITT